MYLSIHLYLDSCLFKIADAPLSTSVEFRREIRKWAPVTRAFEWRPTDRRFLSFLRKLPQDAGARNGEGVATLIFVLFSVFFSDSLSLSLAKIGEEKRKKYRQLIAAAAAPLLKRGSLAKYEHVLVCVDPPSSDLHACLPPAKTARLVQFDPVTINPGYFTFYVLLCPEIMDQ